MKTEELNKLRERAVDATQARVVNLKMPPGTVLALLDHIAELQATIAGCDRELLEAANLESKVRERLAEAWDEGREAGIGETDGYTYRRPTPNPYRHD